MTQQPNNHDLQYKCPHCACIFLSKTDLEKHLQAFSSKKTEHEYNYQKIHGRLEHGYDEE